MGWLQVVSEQGRSVSMIAESGQSSIELIAGIPVLLIAGATALQLLVAGYSLSVADGASQAGAAAAAVGLDPRKAAREALPGWARARTRVASSSGRVRVWITPPAAVPAVAGLLEVESSAWALPDPEPVSGTGGTGA